MSGLFGVPWQAPALEGAQTALFHRASIGLIRQHPAPGELCGNSEQLLVLPVVIRFCKFCNFPSPILRL